MRDYGLPVSAVLHALLLAAMIFALPGAHEQTGITGCFSVDEYEQDVIKKHERTRRDKEDDRTRHIVDLRAQTGVVFLTY